MQTTVKHLYCDVAIIGGGVGGCSAAITASRRGLHTILLDKGVSLGGLATNGYVPQVAGMIEGNCKEFVERLEGDGWLLRRGPEDDHNPTFDPEWAKFLLENMVMEHGGRIIYDATCMDVEMNGQTIKSTIFFTKGGPMAVHATYFIDATGDADVAAMAGVPYQIGGSDYGGLNMSTTLGTRWQGYNKPVYETADKAWREKQIKNGIPRDKCIALIYSLQEKAIEAGELARHIGNNFTGLGQVRIPNTSDKDMGFCTYSLHSYFAHNTDVEDITRQIIEQHQLIQQYEKFLRKYVPGYKNIHLIGIGSLPGVRDSRRIFGDYMLKATDIACGTKFEDGIARFPEMFDTHHPTNSDLIFQRHIHMPAPAGSAVCREPSCSAAMHPLGRPAGIEARHNPRDYCEIPYRSLLPKGVDNLLAVGRCCSAEFHANGAMRIIGPAMGTGQAAGIAVDLANKARVTPREINGKEVRRVLIEEEGVTLNKFPEGWWSKLRDMKGDYKVGSMDFIRIV
jgi:hypothetical protein